MVIYCLPLLVTISLLFIFLLHLSLLVMTIFFFVSHFAYVLMGGGYNCFAVYLGEWKASFSMAFRLLHVAFPILI